MCIKGCWWVEFRRINGPLYVWHLLHIWDTCIPNIWVNRALPAALSTAGHVPRPTLACSHQWAYGGCFRGKPNNQGDTFVTVAPWLNHHNAHVSTYGGGTKGGEFHQPYKKRGRTKGDWQITHTNHPVYYWHTWCHGITQSHSQAGTKSNATYTQMSYKEQYSRYNAHHCHYGAIQANTKGRKATISDSACSKCTHVSGAGATEPSVHPHGTGTIPGWGHPIAHQTLCFADCTPSDRWDHLQLQKLMHNPATSEIWQTAFGKDFGGMVQGDHRTSLKGTNTMFVMTHNEINHVLRQNKKITYGNLVMGFRPQKENPNRICITAKGNLITYESSPSVHTADLDTAKIHWNSVISTPGARYMCLASNITSTCECHLTCSPNGFKSNTIWKHWLATDTSTWKWDMLYRGCHKRASLQTRNFVLNLCCLPILNTSTRLAYGIMNLALFLSPLLSTILVWSTLLRMMLTS